MDDGISKLEKGRKKKRNKESPYYLQNPYHVLGTVASGWSQRILNSKREGLLKDLVNEIGEWTEFDYLV